MTFGRLDELIINLEPNYENKNEELKAIEQKHILNNLITEVKYATGQCKRIEKQSNYTIDILSLVMRGKNTVEEIEVTYMQEGEEKKEKMPLEDFYRFLTPKQP